MKAIDTQREALGSIPTTDQCTDCGSTFPKDHRNTRPIEDALNIEIERLRNAFSISVESVKSLQARLTAAQKLCEIYFNTAAKAIGEEAVRKECDAALKGTPK